MTSETEHIAKQATIYYANQTGRGTPRSDDDIAEFQRQRYLFTAVPGRDDFIYRSYYDGDKNAVMFSVYAKVNEIQIGCDD